MPARQQGLTFFSFLIVLAVVGFLLFLGMRVGPVYLEYFTIRQAMNSVAAEAEAVDLATMRSAMDRRMQIDYASSFDRNALHIQRQGEAVSLVITYEVRRPLLYNLDFVASFEHAAPLRQP